MTEQISTYRDPSFNIDQAYYHTLLLQIDGSSFSYAITHDNKLITWSTGHQLSTLSDLDAQSGDLAANYKKVVIGLQANGFTLVPSVIFDGDQVVNYARLLDVKPHERVLAQLLNGQDHIIYKVDEKILLAVERYGLENTVFSSKGWIMGVANNKSSDKELYLHAENGKVEFLYFKDDRIRLYNSFEYKTADDLSYYAALVADELGLHPDTAQLKISGSIQPYDKFALRLAEFFPDLQFLKIHLLDMPADIDPQQIFSLAALSLCASSEVL